MKIIIFSDVHGNQYAFRQFIEEIHKIEYDKIIFCGDIYGYYYGQSEIIEIMKRMKNLYAVRGNHDQIAIDIFEGKKSKEEYVKKYGHSYDKLKREDISFVKSLPDRNNILIDEKKCVIIHGTLDDVLCGRLYPKDTIKRQELYEKYDIIFCGHTHFQMVRKYKNFEIVNAGSLGQQRDGKGFCYVFIDSEKKIVEYRTIKWKLSLLEKEIKIKDPDNKKMIEILHRGEHEKNISDCN